MICSKRINLIKITVTFIFACFLALPFVAQEGRDDLKYNVSVNVMVVPIFAVDGNGNPVYDLKRDDLRLFVNDKPTDILTFKRYEFGHEQEAAGASAGEKGAETVQAGGDRVIFVIMDTMFNSLTGFRRSKEIAVNLIEEGSTGDNFVVLENNPIGGLKYIGGGSEKERSELVKKIKHMSAPPDKWSKDLHASRILFNNVEYDALTDPRLASKTWESTRKAGVESEKLRYQHQVRYFTRVLSQFKYALKTIDKPKVVFFISEGIAMGAFRAALNVAGPLSEPEERTAIGGRGKFSSVLTQDENTVFDRNKIYSSFMLKYLVEVVKSINNGGSIMYTINPRRTDDINDDEASGEMSLRYLAGESGGKYFAGSKPAKIVERVKKTTAAYYELFYNILPDMGGNMKLRLVCKRKGVNVHSLIHTERNRPYVRMEPVQKKLFALNVVTNGSWSRIVGKVMMAKFKKTGASKEKLMTIRVPLPKVMQDRDVDMFSIRMDPKTQKTAIDVVSSKASDVVNLKIKPRKDKNQFFVIIEPTTPYCIYNRI